MFEHQEFLRNKEGLWVRPSSERWNFVSNGDLIYIVNVSKEKFLGSTQSGEVIFEDFKKDKPEQLWKKGEPNSEGYFTLENVKVLKLLTASSEIQTQLTVRTVHIDPTNLEVSGNITLR